MDYLTGLSDVDLDTDTVNIIISLQLDSGDRAHILTTLNALIRDAKARNAYA